MGFYTNIKTNKLGRGREINRPCIVFRKSLKVEREQGESKHTWYDMDTAIKMVNKENPERKEEYLEFFQMAINNINKDGVVFLLHE